MYEISEWLFLAGETLRTGQSNWVRRSSLVDSRTAVTDVQFAPKHLGLQLVILPVIIISID